MKYLSTFRGISQLLFHFLFSHAAIATSVSDWQEAFYYHLIPGRLAKPHITEFLIPTTVSPDLPEGSESYVIFSLGSSQASENDNILAEYQEINDDIIRIRLKLGLLRYKKIFMNPVHYQSKKERYHNRLKELLREQTSQKPAVQSLEGSELFSRYERIAEKTHLPWSYLSGATTGSINRTLWSRPVRHMIIIGHGDESGFLYDSGRNPFHLSFFKNIPPWVQSVSIYSCHCEKIRELYHLDLAKLSSVYDKRFFFTLHGHRHLMRKGVVWTKGISEFIRQVDQYLFSHNLRDQSQDEHSVPAQHSLSEQSFEPSTTGSEQCFLQTEGIYALEGQWDIILNRQWLGALDLSRKLQVYPFSCSYLNSQNTLLLRQGNAIWPPNIALTSGWKVSLQAGEEQIPVQSQELYRDSKTDKPLSMKLIFGPI